MRCLVCQELATACTAQGAVGGQVNDATVGERLSVEFTSLAIGRRALPNLDGGGGCPNFTLDVGTNVMGEIHTRRLVGEGCLCW